MAHLGRAHLYLLPMEVASILACKEHGARQLRKSVFALIFTQSTGIELRPTCLGEESSHSCAPPL